MTSAYIDAITIVAMNDSYFNLSREQAAQTVQFRAEKALELEVEVRKGLR